MTKKHSERCEVTHKLQFSLEKRNSSKLQATQTSRLFQMWMPKVSYLKLNLIVCPNLNTCKQNLLKPVPNTPKLSSIFNRQLRMSQPFQMLKSAQIVWLLTLKKKLNPLFPQTSKPGNTSNGHKHSGHLSPLYKSAHTGCLQRLPNMCRSFWLKISLKLVFPPQMCTVYPQTFNSATIVHFRRKGKVQYQSLSFGSF